MLSYHTPCSLPIASSPLNPHRSSSPGPMSSPTPSSSALPMTFSPSGPGPSSRRLSARYARTTTTPRRPTAPPKSISSPLPSADPFNEKTTPTERALWNDRLARRVAQSERRKRVKDATLAERRGMGAFDDEGDEDERVQRAQEEDEEIFRRLMVIQRRREEHAAMVGYERETGGEDPNLADFWEGELEAEERQLLQRLDRPGRNKEETEAERWAREAAEAEEEELAAASAAQSLPSEDDMGLGPEDWAAIAALEEDDAMDID